MYGILAPNIVSVTDCAAFYLGKPTILVYTSNKPDERPTILVYTPDKQDEQECVNLRAESGKWHLEHFHQSGLLSKFNLSGTTQTTRYIYWNVERLAQCG